MTGTGKGDYDYEMTGWLCSPPRLVGCFFSPAERPVSKKHNPATRAVIDVPERESQYENGCAHSHPATKVQIMTGHDGQMN